MSCILVVNLLRMINQMFNYSLQGSIVRSIRRLEELVRELHEAMKGVGDTHMAEKFEVAGQKIKRDVIFAASLYL